MDWASMLEKYANYDDSHLDPVAREERELIKRAQRGDIFALKDLQRRYAGVIAQVIREENVTSVMDFASAKQVALAEFDDIIKNKFDLSNTEVRPITFIMGSLKGHMRNLRYENKNPVARMSRDLSMVSESKANATNMLKVELGREPTIEEVHDFIQKNFRTSKSVTLDKLKRIDTYERQDFSGNQFIGGDAQADGAELLTLQDITNTEKKNAADLYKLELNKALVKSILKKYTKEERTFIKEFYGLDEYKNKQAISLRSAAINNNMTNYEAELLIRKFDMDLTRGGIL